jgi:hypothetical protein
MIETRSASGPYRRGIGNPTPLFDHDERAEPPRRHVPETSRAAHRRATRDLLKKYRAILAAFREAGPRGLTVKELAPIVGKLPHQVSPRLSELVDKLRLLRPACDDLGELRRDGARVLVMAESAGASDG